MSLSTNLALPYLASGQAQKHVTVNAAFRRLDALAQCNVITRTLAAQPGAPADGDLYILPAGKSGAEWASMADGALAYYSDGVWEEIAPREGWIAFVKDEDRLFYFTGSTWAGVPVTVSATDKVLGRVSSGAGAIEEISFTDSAQALCDDASFSAMRTTLGLGASDAPQFGSLNLGHASDTTLSRASAGVLAVEGVNVLTTATGAQLSGAAFTGMIDMQRLYPTLRFSEIGGPSNAKYGDFYANSGTLHFTFYNDAFGAAADWLNVTRSGLTPTGINIGCVLQPMSDNAIALGGASTRWSTVYAATGTINTSDAREKTEMQPLPEGLKRAVKRIIRQIGAFQWRSALREKGDDARLHVGVTAQAVRDAFVAEGEDPARWGVFCADEAMETITIGKHTRSIDGVAVETPLTETRALRDEIGAPVLRLGVRHDQLFALALAVLAEELWD